MTEITLNSWLIVLGAIAVWILAASFFALKLFNKKQDDLIVILKEKPKKYTNEIYIAALNARLERARALDEKEFQEKTKSFREKFLKSK